MHPDDPRVDSLFEKAGELGMPISLHVADPIWMYQKMDKTNDGLMNAFYWRLDNQPNIVNLPGMIDILEKTLQRHRKTTFVACHFANLDYDLEHLGQVLERNPNLYADISARYAETAPIRASPRSFTPNTPTVSFTAPTWDSTRKCIASPSAYSNRSTSISTKSTSSPTIGPCTASASATKF